MKQNHIFQQSGQWLEHLNNYPGCDKKVLSLRVQLWLSTAYSLLHVIILSGAFLVFAPEELKILIDYGYFLSIVLTASLILTPRIKKYFKQAYAIQIFVLLTGTFITILQLGGIATSGGLIVVCLALVLCSVPLQDSKISLVLFFYFTIIVVVSALSDGFLANPVQLSPKINSIVFMINTLSMSGLSFYLVMIYIDQQRRLDEISARHLKEVNETRNRMFTNITHEFRTPLTVINGMADLIEKNPDEWLQDGTQKIRINSGILLKLVNQMLDLAKIEAGVMQLHYIQDDINAHARYVTGLFESLAQSQSITLVCKTPVLPFNMDYDPDKLLHIISNLVSNAINNTSEGGKIEVETSLEEGNNWFEIKVSDTGNGIGAELLPHVFERFYYTDRGSRFRQGAGLGLALVKELVDLLSGQIDVQSTQGQGTVFSVRLPVKHYAPLKSTNPGDRQISLETVYAAFPVTNEKHPGPVEKVHAESNLPVLLTVEDSHDVSQYLWAILKNEFNLVGAENGKEGFERAIEQIPDIILSDVMMPVMDGIELLEKVKNDIRTSHIPVVLLTAKADLDSRVSGLKYGADAYLAKPFEEKELRAVLNNLVEIRKKLHKRYASHDNFPLHPESGYVREDEFMSKVRQILEANLDDDEFGISRLCYELAVSRTQLYRKFKSVSNQTISGFFKALRLYKSKILLSTTAMNVTEVAYASGFKNLSYFSREFSAEYGKSPLDFKKQLDLERTVNKKEL